MPSSNTEALEALMSVANSEEREVKLLVPSTTTKLTLDEWVAILNEFITAYEDEFDGETQRTNDARCFLASLPESVFPPVREALPEHTQKEWEYRVYAQTLKGGPADRLVVPTHDNYDDAKDHAGLVLETNQAFYPEARVVVREVEITTQIHSTGESPDFTMQSAIHFAALPPETGS